MPLGGGKTVVVGDPRTDKTPAKFVALGGFIDRLNGSYLAAEDVGTTTDDAELVATRTQHITGLPVARGGSGDPSPMTAWGVVCGIRAALAEARVGDGELEGVHVAVQGLGHVGADVARHLLEARRPGDGRRHLRRPACSRWPSWAPRRRRRTLCTRSSATSSRRARWAPGSTAPRFPELRCRIIAGAANNQLADETMGDELQARGILYAPDFAINAGGVINIGEELQGPYDPDRARRSVERIGDTLAAVFERARETGVSTHTAALAMARERIDAARSASANR